MQLTTTQQTIKTNWDKMFEGEGITETFDFFPSNQLPSNLRVWGITQIPPNSKIGLHDHPNEIELLYVLQGSGSTTSSKEKLYLSPGDGLKVGPNESHIIESGADGLTLFATIISCPDGEPNA